MRLQLETVENQFFGQNTLDFKANQLQAMGILSPVAPKYHRASHAIRLLLAMSSRVGDNDARLRLAI